MDPDNGPGSPPRRFPILLVVALVVLFGSSVAGWLVTAGALGDRERALEATSEAVERVTGRLEELETSLETSLERLAALEETASPDLAVLAAKVQGSVFVVRARGVLGSAFVVRSDEDRSLLLTNYHVVALAWEAGSRQVEIRHEKQDLDGRVLRVDKRRDLALISVDEELPALELQRKLPDVGDHVVVVGAPFGLERTVADGIVSAIREDHVQFSAPVSPGDSGGPLVDENGMVIGVTVAKIAAGGAEGLSFAVPSGVVCRTVLDC